MSTGTKVTLGILGAIAAGVCIGLLIAPDKGSETRKRIAETTGDWADKLKNAFNKGQEEYENLKEKARGLKTSAEERVSRVKENLG
jgi:gas vesicle protein